MTSYLWKYPHDEPNMRDAACYPEQRPFNLPIIQSWRCGGIHISYYTLLLWLRTVCTYSCCFRSSIIDVGVDLSTGFNVVTASAMWTMKLALRKTVLSLVPNFWIFSFFAEVDSCPEYQNGLSWNVFIRLMFRQRQHPSSLHAGSLYLYWWHDIPDVTIFIGVLVRLQSLIQCYELSPNVWLVL